MEERKHWKKITNIQEDDDTKLLHEMTDNIQQSVGFFSLSCCSYLALKLICVCEERRVVRLNIPDEIIKNCIHRTFERFQPHATAMIE